MGNSLEIVQKDIDKSRRRLEKKLKDHRSRQESTGESNNGAFLIDACTTLFQNGPTSSFERDGDESYEDDESFYTKDDESTLGESYKEYNARKKKQSGRDGDRRGKRYEDDDSTYDGSLMSGSLVKGGRGGNGRDDYSASSSTLVSDLPSSNMKPLASSFAKRCHFTKAGIGKTTPHYEGLTLTGQVVLMLPTSMKLKGCPTICDEDLRRVEQMYPNQFSRLPDELLLSSGWRRISKYCHFSNKSIPDGVPFFHSRDRLKNGNYYFLLAAAVGMNRPSDVEPLTRDTLVLLETDFPNQCDQLPSDLLNDPTQWILIDKFCFFSGGPIHEEDVYYRANLDGNSVHMLAFLSPSLGPEELYRLNSSPAEQFPSMQAVHDVESVYNLTDRDFDDLKLYHLGPCRALPPYLLSPQHWNKVLAHEFVRCRNIAMERAQKIEGAAPRQSMMDTQPRQPIMDPRPRQQQQIPLPQDTPLQYPTSTQLSSSQLPPQQHAYQSGYSQLPYPPTPGSVLSDPNNVPNGNQTHVQMMNHNGFSSSQLSPKIQSQQNTGTINNSVLVGAPPIPEPQGYFSMPNSAEEPLSLAINSQMRSSAPPPRVEGNFQVSNQSSSFNSNYMDNSITNPALALTTTMSDVTSVVSGSSVWTDADPTSRSVRRAMIVKMAKERMKSVKQTDEIMKKGALRKEHIDFSDALD